MNVLIAILIYLGIMFITYWLKEIVKILEKIKDKLWKWKSQIAQARIDNYVEEEEEESKIIEKIEGQLSLF